MPTDPAAPPGGASGVRVTLLGTGTSTGVPVIGCRCSVCTSADVRDMRSRASCLIEAGGLSIVVDTGPDFRRQALAAGLTRVDAVLFTHAHFDHIVGVDDLRPFLFGNPAPICCYADPGAAEVISRMFCYIFEQRTYPGAPNLEMRPVTGPFEAQGRYDRTRRLRITPVPAFHGNLPLYGYRIGRFAYLTDTSALPETSFALLEGVDVLVLGALRREPHPTHFSIDEAAAVAARIGARAAYFTHMTHSVSHARDGALLPPGVFFGYDGLCFDVRSEETLVRAHPAPQSAP